MYNTTFDCVAANDSRLVNAQQHVHVSRFP